MEKPKHHIFVCMSFRGLEPKGKCIRKNAGDLLAYLESELADRGLDKVMVSTTGCLKLCDQGPIMVIYPQWLLVCRSGRRGCHRRHPGRPGRGQTRFGLSDLRSGLRGKRSSR